MASTYQEYVNQFQDPSYQRGANMGYLPKTPVGEDEWNRIQSGWNANAQSEAQQYGPYPANTPSPNTGPGYSKPPEPLSSTSTIPPNLATMPPSQAYNPNRPVQQPSQAYTPHPGYVSQPGVPAPNLGGMVPRINPNAPTNPITGGNAPWDNDPVGNSPGMPGGVPNRGLGGQTKPAYLATPPPTGNPVMPNNPFGQPGIPGGLTTVGQNTPGSQVYNPNKDQNGPGSPGGSQGPGTPPPSPTGNGPGLPGTQTTTPPPPGTSTTNFTRWNVNGPPADLRTGFNAPNTSYQDYLQYYQQNLAQNNPYPMSQQDWDNMPIPDRLATMNRATGPAAQNQETAFRQLFGDAPWKPNQSGRPGDNSLTATYMDPTGLGFTDRYGHHWTTNEMFIDPSRVIRDPSTGQWIYENSNIRGEAMAAMQNTTNWDDSWWMAAVPLAAAGVGALAAGAGVEGVGAGALPEGALPAGVEGVGAGALPEGALPAGAVPSGSTAITNPFAGLGNVVGPARAAVTAASLLGGGLGGNHPSGAYTGNHPTGTPGPGNTTNPGPGNTTNPGPGNSILPGPGGNDPNGTTPGGFFNPDGSLNWQSLFNMAITAGNYMGDQSDINDYRSISNDFINRGDYNSQYRPGQLDRLNQFMMNPEAALDDPGYQAVRNRNLDNLDRRYAARGMSLSGNEMGAETAYGRELDYQHINDERNQLRQNVQLGNPDQMARAGLLTLPMLFQMRANQRAGLNANVNRNNPTGNNPNRDVEDIGREIFRDHPDWSDEQIQEEIIRQTGGDDTYDENDWQNIMSDIHNSNTPGGPGGDGGGPGGDDIDWWNWFFGGP